MADHRLPPVKVLRQHSRAKTPVAQISKLLKRTEADHPDESLCARAFCWPSPIRKAEVARRGSHQPRFSRCLIRIKSS